MSYYWKCEGCGARGTPENCVCDGECEYCGEPAADGCCVKCGEGLHDDHKYEEWRDRQLAGEKDEDYW